MLPFLGGLAFGASMLSCSDSTGAPLIAPSGDVVSVCHVSRTSGSVIQIYASDLAMHRSHGDYVAGLVVDKDSKTVGDSIHFTRIGDAITAARAVRIARNETSTATCPITIAVAPGVFQGSAKDSADPALEHFPLVLDVPDITLEGSFRMQVDAGGRATGSGDGPGITTLVASPGLTTVKIQTGGPQFNLGQPMIIVNGHPDGSQGNGITIRGFVFQSGNGSDAAAGGQGVYTMRVQGFAIEGNRFEGGFSEPVALQATTARVEHNYLTGKGGTCGICLTGPGAYEVTGNRQMGPGGIPGIFIVPAELIVVSPVVEPYVLPQSSVVTAIITNNEVRNHLNKGAGAGLRIGALGPAAPNVIGSAIVVARGNTLVNNTFGVMVEAAFPVPDTNLRGDIDLTLEGNDISGSCQNNALVGFARNSKDLGITSGAQFQSDAYLRNSTFALKLNGDLQWDDVWFSHPAGFGNTLTVDGETIASGSRSAYDDSRVCSASAAISTVH